jgi:hypothetical protein
MVEYKWEDEKRVYEFQFQEESLRIPTSKSEILRTIENYHLLSNKHQLCQTGAIPKKYTKNVTEKCLKFLQVTSPISKNSKWRRPDQGNSSACQPAFTPYSMARNIGCTSSLCHQCP